MVERSGHEELVGRVRFDPEVRNLWREIIEPIFEISLIAAGDQFYLAGGLAGGIFNYSNEELRYLLGVQRNQELFLCSFIVITLLAAFYDSEDGIAPSRESLPVTELAEMVTRHLQELGGDPAVEELENRTRVNLREPAELWLDLPYQKTEVKHIRRSDCRLAYLLKTIDLLQEHGLVRMIQDRQIFPRERLNQLIAHYYNQQARKNEILEMLRGGMANLKGGVDDAPDQPGEDT